MVASNAAREQTHSCEGADGHTPGPSFDPSNCIGNSGSGKSSFADGLGALIHAPVFDLDLIHGKTMGSEPSKTKIWLGRRLPTSPRHSVGSSKACTVAAESRSSKSNGPYVGWMSLGMSAGRGLLARGLRCSGTEADFAELLRWAEAYRDRQTPTSVKGHPSTTIRWNPLPPMICAFGAHRH